MEIKKEILSYQNIRDGYNLEDDPDKIGAYTLQPNILKTFLDNPSLKDYNKTMIMFCRVDGKIVARSMLFPVRLKAGDTCIIAQSGSSLYSNPEYRQSALGVDLMRYPLESKEYPFIIYAGLTKMVIPMFKAMHFSIFSFPELWQPRRSEFAFRSKGLNGLPLRFFSFCADSLISLINAYNKKIVRRAYKDFKVNRLKVIPIWAEDIVKKDNHKYAEIHDRAWMTWALNNNFFGKENEEQGFYEILRNEEPIGFFMTKIRNLTLPEHNIKSVIFGNVFEWGSLDENLLSEYDIYRMASLTFPKCVDIYDVATTDEGTAKRMKKFFMFRHGDAHIVVKDLTKLYSDSKDITNWRIRYGYADVPFY